MKAFLTTLMTLAALWTYGQHCESYEGKDINCVDREGFRQGYWEMAEYTWEVINPQAKSPRTQKTRTALKCRGSFLDDRKVGTWEYFIFPGTADAQVEKTVTYFDNGSTVEESLYWGYVLTKIPDGEKLHGKLIYREDRVDFHCADGRCHFAVDEDVEFASNALAQLDFELDKFRMGLYDGKIAALRAAAQVEYEE